jgi:hypothetical protein
MDNVVGDAYEFALCINRQFEGVCEGQDCLKDRFKNAPECAYAILAAHAENFKQEMLQSSEMPEVLKNIMMMTTEEQKAILDATWSFAKDFLPYLGDELKKSSNWLEQSSMCFEEIPFIVPTDCGALEYLSAIGPDAAAGSVNFAMAIESLNRCASNTIDGRPAPFMEHSKQGFCLPKIVDVIADKFKNDPRMQFVISEIQELLGNTSSVNPEDSALAAMQPTMRSLQARSQNSKASAVDLLQAVRKANGMGVYKLAVNFGVEVDFPFTITNKAGAKFKIGLRLSGGLRFAGEPVKVNYTTDIGVALQLLPGEGSVTSEVPPTINGDGDFRVKAIGSFTVEQEVPQALPFDPQLVPTALLLFGLDPFQLGMSFTHTAGGATFEGSVAFSDAMNNFMPITGSIAVDYNTTGKPELGTASLITLHSSSGVIGR